MDGPFTRKIVSFDEFAYCCPFFTSETEVNNGYGCKHPAQEQREENQAVGSCYCWSCPLGIEAEAEDCGKKEIDYDGITDQDIKDGEGNSQYLLINCGKDAAKEEKAALYSYERFAHWYDLAWLAVHGK